MVTEPQSPRIAIDTAGCKLNQAESQSLAQQCQRAGYQLVPPAAGCDVYILNTCTVTRVADRKCRHLLRVARRRNPQAAIVALGCYAGRAGDELARATGADLILDNARKPELLRLLEASGRLRRPSPAPGSAVASGRTRALVKVQDGCRNFCAYCIVPLVRGGEKSVPAATVLAEVSERGDGGYREVVLTGTKVGSYRHGGLDLRGLLARVLDETGVERLRLSSLQPPELSPELVELWANPRLCRHFHLSLQSGSDAVLRRMGRGYSVGEFERALARLRDRVPGVAITTDVIVGFPGETEAEFWESYERCRSFGFARIHVFPYSPRPGTTAALMPGPVGEATKRERAREMLALAADSARQFRRRFLGQTMTVLWETRRGGVWQGLTDNYIKVYARSRADLTNSLLPVALGELGKDGVWGVIPQHPRGLNPEPEVSPGRPRC